MDVYGQVKQVMTHKDIPPGQLRVLKALYEAPKGLTLRQLAATSDCTVSETSSTLGAFGNRVTQALGKPRGEPLEIVVRKYRVRRRERYTLTAALRTFIDARPDFKAALEDSEMEQFYLHTSHACSFVWDERGYGGELKQFERNRGS